MVLDKSMIDPASRRVYLDQLRLAKHKKFGHNMYSTAFKSSARALRLPPLSLHMLRHGAASEDFFRGLRRLDAIQVRGRWRSFASIRRYQKSGRLLSFLSKCDQAIVAEAQVAASSGLAFV